MGFERFFSRSTSRRSRVPRGLIVYAVGDIHGRDDLLSELLGQIEADLAARTPRRALLVFLGDLIDRGPASSQVVERLRTLRLADAKLVFLAGNHEEALLRVLEGDDGMAKDWLKFGGRECLVSYGADDRAIAAMDTRSAARAIRRAIPPEHREFIARFGDTLQVGEYLFVHAGIRPGVPLARQTQTDLRWIRGQFLNDERDHGFVVVHGHTITTDVDEAVNRIGIDTGAYRSGVLTALVLDGEQRRYIQTRVKEPVPPQD